MKWANVKWRPDDPRDKRVRDLMQLMDWLTYKLTKVQPESAAAIEDDFRLLRAVKAEWNRVLDCGAVWSH